MGNFWRSLKAPTLVRRVIIAQMLLLTLLWCLFLTFILWSLTHFDELALIFPSMSETAIAGLNLTNICT